MQAAPARYVSVSELYSTDEVELLLDEIRELEPTSCRGEDIQDFEIAGSGAETGAGGGRSPANTERSWDSHAHYSRRAPPPPRPLAPLYCSLRQLCTIQSLLTLLIVVVCVCSCSCVWAGAGWAVGRLPRAGRVRLLLLASLSSALCHAALLFMHVTRLATLLPFDWDKLALATCAWSATSLSAGAALTLHAVLAAPEYRWTPPLLADLLYSAAGLGMCGALVAGLLSLRLGAGLRRGRGWGGGAYRAAPTHDHL